MSKGKSSYAPVLITLSVLAGGGVFAYYALKSSESSKDESSDSSSEGQTTTTTTKRVTTSTSSSSSDVKTKEGVDYFGTEDGDEVDDTKPAKNSKTGKKKERKPTREAEQQKASEGNKALPEAVRKEQGLGIITDAKIKFNNDITILNYKKTGDYSYAVDDTYGPLDMLYFSKYEIASTVPRLGLATDLVKAEGAYQPLKGIIGGAPASRTRQQNIDKIKACLGIPREKDLSKAITNRMKERLATLIYNVVVATDNYWDVRNEAIINKFEKFSDYVFGRNGKPSNTKKQSGGLNDAEKNRDGLFDLDESILGKQRVAANTLWAIMQASDDKNVGRGNDKKKPDMSDPNSRIVQGMQECIYHIFFLSVPKDDSMQVSNRYYRGIVDAFFDGCFNCEVPEARAIYLDRSSKYKWYRDYKLKQQGNLCICEGLVFHSNNHPGTNMSKDDPDNEGVFG